MNRLWALTWLPGSTVGCATIHEAPQTPVVRVERSELPPVKLRRKPRLTAAREPRGVVLVGAETCEQRATVRTTGTQEVKRTSTRQWKAAIPVVAATGGGLAVDLAGSRGFVSWTYAGALFGGIGSVVAFGVDRLREIDRTESIDRVSYERRELECARTPLSMTPVVLLLASGVRVTRVTDGAGVVVLPSGVDALVVAVDVLGEEVPVRDDDDAAR